MHEKNDAHLNGHHGALLKRGRDIAFSVHGKPMVWC